MNATTFGLVDVIKTCASLAACYLFVSPLRDILLIRATKSTANVQLLPLLCMFANGMCWCIYGILVRDFFPIFLTNFIGVALSCFYIVVFYSYTPHQAQATKKICGMVVALTGLAMYPMCSMEPKQIVQTRVGYIAIGVCAFMFASPLAVVREAIQKKNADLLPLPMILSGFVNSCLWLMYGFILHDLFVIVPNFINLILGLVQLVLILQLGGGGGTRIMLSSRRRQPKA